MAEKFSKREFVDENPYLVYTSEEDTAYNGSGGSGTIPIATADTLGGVKVGDGLSITEAGVLSASGGIFIVNLTEQVGSNEWSVDKSYSEIAEQITNGNYNILLISNISNQVIAIPFDKGYIDANYGGIRFTYCDPSSSNIVIYTYSISANEPNKATRTAYTINSSNS